MQHQKMDKGYPKPVQHGFNGMGGIVTAALQDDGQYLPNIRNSYIIRVINLD